MQRFQSFSIQSQHIPRIGIFADGKENKKRENGIFVDEKEKKKRNECNSHTHANHSLTMHVSSGNGGCLHVCYSARESCHKERATEHERPNKRRWMRTTCITDR